VHPSQRQLMYRHLNQYQLHLPMFLRKARHHLRYHHLSLA
jgi:hypothetical protein